MSRKTFERIAGPNPYKRLFNKAGVCITIFGAILDLAIYNQYVKGPYFYYVRKIVGGWVHQNAYNGLFTLHK